MSETRALILILSQQGKKESTLLTNNNFLFPPVFSKLNLYGSVKPL